MTSAIAIGASLFAGGALLGLGLTRLVAHLPRAVAASRSGSGIVPSLIPAAAALRLALAGIALVVLGLGWLAEVSWLGNLALVFGLEELYETTMVVGCLRWAERQGAQAAVASAPRFAALSRVPSGAASASALPAAWTAGAWRTARWV